MNVNAHVTAAAITLTVFATLFLVFPSPATAVLAFVSLSVWLVALWLAVETRRVERGERS